MTINTAVADQLTRARTQLILDHPFFGQLALRLQLIERPDVKTLCVDGKHIFYNPDFVASLSPALTKAAVAHEVMHPVFDHINRRGAREPRKWNQAGDYVINLMLKDSGFQIGDGWLISEGYRDMTADEIYTMLPENDENDGGSPGSGGAGDPLDEMVEGEQSEADASMEAMDWQIAAVQAANAAKAVGKLPGSLERFVDQMTKPKVDWRDVLRRFICETSKDDYSWARPNRRFVGQGFYLPGLWSETMGVLVDAIDTSGSIGQDVLNAFGAEITAARDASRPSELVNIYCDAEVNHVDKFGPHDELHFKMHGGGGTDFRPPFKHVETNGIKPACFVYLTDGYGPFPATPPDYPVLWVMTTDVQPPWGECVRIEL